MFFIIISYILSFKHECIPMRSWIEISRSAFNHNISLLASTMQPMQLAVIIKANAYGHGLLPIATLAEDHPAIAMLCVIGEDELIQVRAHGIKKPLISLSYRVENPDHFLSLYPSLVVYDEDMIASINAAAAKRNIKAKIHLKVDTGLTRLGFFADQIPPLLEKIKSWYPHVYLEGILTHLSHKNQDGIEYSLNQISTFTELVRELHTSGYYFPMVHALSSNGCVFPSPRATHLRIGHHMYGFGKFMPEFKHADGKVDTLKLVGTWKTKIHQLKNVNTGTYVGYIRTYKTTRPTRLAILPVGYSDGYPRTLSNKGHVLIHGMPAPILGIISMNLIAVDVTDIALQRSVQINDEVILMGPQHPLIHSDTLAKDGESIPVELWSRINHSIPRIIVE